MPTAGRCLGLVTAGSERAAYAGGLFASNGIVVDKFSLEVLVRWRLARATT
jgi:hypothetical protein